jgi:hypothetical protein
MDVCRASSCVVLHDFTNVFGDDFILLQLHPPFDACATFREFSWSVVLTLACVLSPLFAALLGASEGLGRDKRGS